MANQKIITRGLLAFLLSGIILMSNMMFVNASAIGVPINGSGTFYGHYDNSIVMGEEYNITVVAETPNIFFSNFIDAQKTYWFNMDVNINTTCNLSTAKVTDARWYFVLANSTEKIPIYRGWNNFNVTGVTSNAFKLYVEVDLLIPKSNNISASSVSITNDYTIKIVSCDIVNTVDEQINSSIQEGNTLQQEANETSKGIFNKITEFFNGFFDNLGNTVLSWIVPTAEQLTAFLNEVNAWFSDRLGFIWYPFSLAIDMVAAFAGGDANSSFNVPALEITLMGNKYKIWDSMTIDMDAFDIFKYVRYFTSVILVAGVVKLAYDKWDEWIGGHGVG